MLLRDLFRQFDPNLSTMRLPDVRVTGIAEDSRRVLPGYVFVARPGLHTDGAQHVTDAAARGASVVVAGKTLTGAPLPVVVVPDPSTAASQLANLFHRRPAEALKVIGVTGTNGKTTVTYLIRHILASAGKRCGLIGTVETDDGDRVRPAAMTTPGGVEVADLLARMRDHDCAACAMEVSSHALEQGRVAGVRFSAAVFTNLTRDHLDYHGTMDAYASAKARLFERLSDAAVAIVNRDSEWSQHMLRNARARSVGFAMKSSADYTARDIAVTAAGSNFVLVGPDGQTPVRMRLIGRHNIENALAASAACAEVFGLTVHQIAQSLRTATGAPGRLERVEAGQPFTILVDYAHTDDALRNVLATLRPICRGKLRVMFGAGGDRDRSKRPLMAAAVCEFADSVVITSDNPRTENPRLIIEEILSGVPADRHSIVTVEEDRRAAIERIIGESGGGDVVLLAGKGHEKTQVIGSTQLPFDDVEEARRAVEKLGVRS